jgi:hypothetical protein
MSKLICYDYSLANSATELIKIYILRLHTLQPDFERELIWKRDSLEMLLVLFRKYIDNFYYITCFAKHSQNDYNIDDFIEKWLSIVILF